jgi:hypothetical protein
MNENQLSVVILSGDRVVAWTDSVTAVRVAAGSVAGRQDADDTDAAFWPVAAGVREACRRIAMAEIPA